MDRTDDLESLRKTLRTKLRDGAEFTIGAAAVRLLMDELSRLQQSNDRLRRQNRRVRLKLQRAGLATDEPADAADGDGEPAQ